MSVGARAGCVARGARFWLDYTGTNRARCWARSSRTGLTSMAEPGSMMHTPRGEARSEDVRSPSCCRRNDGVGLDGSRDDRDAGGELGRLRGRRVVGPDGQGLPTARCRATTAGMRAGAVVGPDGQCMPAARCRAATAGMRQRLVVGSGRQRMSSASGAAGRLILSRPRRKALVDKGIDVPIHRLRAMNHL
jgi:hypothetical protein